MVWIFQRFLSVIYYDRRVLSEDHKNYFKDWCLMKSQPNFMFWPIFNSWKWPYYQKELLHYKHEILSLVVLIWKWMGLFLRKKHLLRCCGCLSLLNWIGALTLSLLLKLHPRKLEPWLFVLWSFFLLKLLCIFTNLAYDFAWSTVVMSRLVLLAATWNC